MQMLEKEFLEVYEKAADGVFRFCYWRTFNRETARDLTQEAFTRTWLALVNGNDIKNLRAFVYKVARNLVIDQSRKKKEMSLEALMQVHEPEFRQRFGDFVDSKLVLEALEKLEDDYKEVLLMRYIEELKPSEIAEILGETPNAVSIRINRAASKLREILKYDERNT